MRLLKSHPLLRLANSYLVDSPQPINLSYLWNFGSLLAFCLVIQIITGVTLAINGLLWNLTICWNTLNNLNIQLIYPQKKGGFFQIIKFVKYGNQQET